MSFEVSLTAYDGNHVTDTTTLWGSLKIGSDHNRVLMYFVNPASQRGRKLLVDGDSVYLLFVRTTNPIRLSPLEVLTGQASDGDVVRTFARDYDVESMTDGTLEGTPVYHFSLVAKESVGDTSYKRVQLWVDRDNLRLREAEFYAASGVLLKKAYYRDYRETMGKDIPFVVEVFAGDDVNKRTVMTFDKVGRRTVPSTEFQRSFLPAWNPGPPDESMASSRPSSLRSGLPAFALEGEIDVDAAPSATLAPIQGPGSPLGQAEATRITSQLALSGHAAPTDALTLSATGWALLDTLPDYNPLDVPANRLDLSSRLLQADVSWQIIPGALIWDTGKEIIHPSVGFFRTPLNLISRGAAGNVPQQIPGRGAAVGGGMDRNEAPVDNR